MPARTIPRGRRTLLYSRVMANLRDALVNWLRQQVDDAGSRGLVVGLSGGVDSAVVARLSQLAMPDRIVGVLLPCHSNPQDARDAHLVAERFEIPTITVALEATYDTLVKSADAALQSLSLVSEGAPEKTDDIRAQVPVVNIKPRLRMTTLYFVANRLNYLVAGTGNKSELAIGYFTKYGDGGVDLLPLGSLVKSQVWALARELDVPTPVITKAPSAGLWLGQTDEAEMGFTYTDLEKYLTDGPQSVSKDVAQRIARLVRSSEHKRKMPPTFTF
jgi:NAD+ synthase